MDTGENCDPQECDEPMLHDGGDVEESAGKVDAEMFPVLGDAGEGGQGQPAVEATRPSKWYSESVSVSNSIVTDQVALDKFSDVLDGTTIAALANSDISHLFPVQCLVIPELITCFSVGGRHVAPPADLCIATPTGSGKTLCYVVPIVQTLRARLVPRIRALVVVPTSELGQQVYGVFMALTKNTNLRVLLLRASISVQRDRTILTNRGCAFDADVIVTTPPYLMNHMKSCDSRLFDLRHLRYLVIDEADRVLSVYEPDWIQLLEKLVYRQEKVNNFDCFCRSGQCLMRMPPLHVNRKRLGARSAANLQAASQLPLQKILLSATLNLDPDVLKHLNLYRLKMYSVAARRVDSQDTLTLNEQEGLPAVSLPENLDERYLVCGAMDKPLIIYALLRRLDWSRVLCFTETLEHSHRLALLLNLMKLDNIQELSGSLLHYRRGKVIRDFQIGKIRAIVCTDLLSRGVDLEGVECVICYDVPMEFLQYVHRAGRTCRAGKSGMVLTVFTDEEMNDRSPIGSEILARAKPLDFDTTSVKEFSSQYESALQQLQERVFTESRRKRIH